MHFLTSRVAKAASACLAVVLTASTVATTTVDSASAASQAAQRRSTVTERVGSANVYVRLPDSRANVALNKVTRRADVLGLQEWGPNRDDVLRTTGQVIVFKGNGHAARKQRIDTGWVWVRTSGFGMPVGARAERYTALSARTVVLSRRARVERQPGTRSVVPINRASVAILDDNRTRADVAVINYHLIAHMQRGGHYDRRYPKRERIHRAERRVLERLVAEYRAKGLRVYALGDSNFDGMRLKGVTSAWSKFGHMRGTHRRSDRHIDDVFGPGAPVSVRVIDSPSDHSHPIVTREVSTIALR